MLPAPNAWTPLPERKPTKVVIMIKQTVREKDIWKKKVQLQAFRDQVWRVEDIDVDVRFFLLLARAHD